MADRRVVIIGGGHNGLITAFYLAKAGFKPLILERCSQVGGAAVTDEFHSGFRCSTLAHAAGPIRPDVVRAMQLAKHGLKLITPEVAVVALSPEGRALHLYNDTKKTAEEISKFQPKDGARYSEFQEALRQMGRVIAKALVLAPPRIDNPNRGDLWGMLQTGRAIRNLGKKNMYRLLRWGPMAVADLVAEFFETELLRATIAARGIFGTFLGPWSAGTSLVLLLRAAADPNPAGENFFAAGGAGSITQAMAAAAQQAGAGNRTGAEGIEIPIKDGRGEGRGLSPRQQNPSRRGLLIR